MGLSAVELAMDVEDHFGITIMDAEAERVRTVGDLVALIRSRIVAAEVGPCPTMPAFLSLRRLVREIINDDTHCVRPRHAVATLLALRERRQLWRRLPELLGTAPRPLRRPPLLRKMLVSISVCVLVCAFIPAAIDWQIVPLTLFMAAIFICVLHIVSSPLRVFPPDGWMTVGDITRRIAGTIAATTNLNLNDDVAVLHELQPIIVEQLGVDRDEVVPAARLIEDLGMD